MTLTNTALNISLVASVSVAICGAFESYFLVKSPPMIEGVGYVINPVGAGDRHVVHWTITKRTRCSGVVWRRWEGEGGFILKEARIPAKIRDSPHPQILNVVTRIPPSSPTGELDLFIDVEYDCGTGRVFPFTLGPVEMTVE